MNKKFFITIFISLVFGNFHWNSHIKNSNRSRIVNNCENKKIDLKKVKTTTILFYSKNEIKNNSKKTSNNNKSFSDIIIPSVIGGITILFCILPIITFFVKKTINHFFSFRKTPQLNYFHESNKSFVPYELLDSLNTTNIGEASHSISFRPITKLTDRFPILTKSEEELIPHHVDKLYIGAANEDISQHPTTSTDEVIHSIKQHTDVKVIKVRSYNPNGILKDADDTWPKQKYAFKSIQDRNWGDLDLQNTRYKSSKTLSEWESTLREYKLDNENIMNKKISSYNKGFNADCSAIIGNDNYLYSEIKCTLNSMNCKFSWFWKNLIKNKYIIDEMYTYMNEIIIPELLRIKQFMLSQDNSLEGELSDIWVTLNAEYEDLLSQINIFLQKINICVKDINGKLTRIDDGSPLSILRNSLQDEFSIYKAKYAALKSL